MDKILQNEIKADEMLPESYGKQGAYSELPVAYDAKGALMPTSSLESAYLTPFGDGNDGDVIISVDTTLTRDMFYENLTINNGVSLNVGSYRIFVKETLINNGTIHNNGNNASGNTAGAAIASGSLPGAVAGVNGGSAVAISNGALTGGAAIAGNSVAKALGNAAVAGVGGGDSHTDASGNGPAGATAAAGSKTGTIFNAIRNYIAAYNLFDVLPSFAQLGGPPSGSSGSGGGSSCSTASGTCSGSSGSGGGSGGPGGIVTIFAKKIENKGIISVVGGDAGAGSNASFTGTSTNYAGGGGGAGAPGNGGIIILVYSILSAEGTLNISAGATASGGTGVAGGTNSYGNSGGSSSAANDGLLIKIKA